MLFIPLLALSGVGRMVPGLSIPPQDRHRSCVRGLLSSPGLRTPVDAGRDVRPRRGQDVEGGQPRRWGSFCPQSQSRRSPSAALTAMRVLCSLAPCWPCISSAPRSGCQHLPGGISPRHSSAVVPNSPVFPREESRGAAVAAPQVQVPSWWPPPAAASLGSALPALQAVVSLSRSWVHQAGLQAEHSRAGRTIILCPTG